MKKTILSTSLLILVTLLSTSGFSQSLDEDQNPNFAASRDKYISIADSLNSWHSTTFQETYKAIDYMADRAAARESHRMFRRELRLARAQNGYYDYGYYPMRNRYYNYPYNNRFYNRYDPVYYRSRFRNDRILRSLPLALALAWCWR